MKLYRHYTGLPDSARGASVAIGNFDGVHPGHRAVLMEAASRARTLDAPLGVVTFEPHPRRFFRPDDPPFQITSLRSKTHALQNMGAALIYALRFDAGLAGLPAAAFVDEVLVKGLGVRCAVTGEDFVFGKRRGGDSKMLAELAAARGFDYAAVPVRHEAGGPPYASTRIRDCLRNGDMRMAATLLGRRWEVEGRIESGDRRGRSIGFPTANMRIADYVSPAPGVYAVQTALDEGGPLDWRDAVANYGRRPTFGGGAPLLETHILDFEGDLYGCHLRVRFVDFIRPETAFGDMAALRAQIVLDCRKAKDILAASDSERTENEPAR